LFRQSPIGQQFSFVAKPPFLNQRHGLCPHAPFNRPSLNLDRDLPILILRMEMGRGVLTLIHVDHDTEKTADYRHLPSSRN
jgi:hypothetical protein